MFLHLVCLKRRVFYLVLAWLLVICVAGELSAQSPPTIAKAFSAASIPLNSSTRLTFTITNPNPATNLTNVSFNDTLPAGLIIANPDSLVPDPVLGNCDPTGTTGLITPAVSSISLTGGQIPASATCTFSIDVLSVSAGTQVNTTDPITSTEGGTGGTATATIDVVLPDLMITKTHTGTFLRPQTGVTYTLTVSNVGQGDTSALITVTDNLPAGLTATAIDGGPNWSCTVSPLQCTRGDVLTAGASFEPITLTVNVAQNAPDSITNTASVSGGTESSTGNNTANDVATSKPALVLAAQSTSLTVKAGSSGSATLNLTANGPGLGPITFACSGLPAGATCIFNPSSVSATATVTMTVSVPKNSAVGLMSWRTPPPLQIKQQWLWIALLCWIVSLACAKMWIRRMRPRNGMALATVGIAVCLALAGCGGGGKSTLFNTTVTASSPAGGSVTAGVSLTVVN